MSEETLDCEKEEPWEGTKVEEPPDPPASEKCPQCGRSMQISRKNDKVYCLHCEEYNEDMK